jgi:ketosteroid isomerase-like protein
MRVASLFFSFLLTAGIALATEQDEEAIGSVLDDFHDAAAHGDRNRYLGHLTDDAVFMGTDEWERWPLHPDFANYVDGRFENGAGWNYRSVERNIRVAGSGDVAWFDEVIFSQANGRFRGTGVLLRQDGTWKIAQYAMSFLVFNENWQDVIELTRRTRAGKEAN